MVCKHTLPRAVYQVGIRVLGVGRMPALRDVCVQSPGTSPGLGRKSLYCLVAILVVAALSASPVQAEPWAAPGDNRLRHDLQLLNDTGVIDIPLTAWPMAWGEIYSVLDNATLDDLSPVVAQTVGRVRQRARNEIRDDFSVIELSATAGDNLRTIRSFEDTPREDGEITAGVSWIGERFALNLRGTYAGEPLDGDDFRPDGTYVGVAVGNWMLSAGWLERWWGPGRDSSMILSTNARPMPSIGLQRIGSLQSESKWFRWIGPWTLTTFMGQLDDERRVNDPLFWGLRGSFRPLRGLEIGLSRTAQWCGDGRPCDLQTFFRVLNGNDNVGANVGADNEPGNQLGGIDLRWTLPRQIPLALYMQWTAEDTRDTGGSLQKWLRQVGVEYWGTIGDSSHRLHFEVADTTCRFGGLGEGRAFPDCAYNHGIFKSGYRYNGRAIGHAMDGDGLSFSLGSTLVQSAGHTWNLSLRYININRNGDRDPRHTLSATPQDLADIQLSHDRYFSFGRIHAAVGYSRLDDQVTGRTTSEASGFIRWSLH